METAGRLLEKRRRVLNFDVIAGYGRTLPARLSIDEDARDGLENMLALANQGRQLAGRLSAYTQRRLPRPAAFDLNDLIVKLTALLECAVGDAVEVVPVLAAQAVMVTADRGLTEQLILTLATAARDAMPEGGKLTVETSVAELFDEELLAGLSLSPGRYARLSLSYTGTDSRMEEELPEVTELAGLAGGGLRLRSEPGRLMVYEIHLPGGGESAQ